MVRKRLKFGFMEDKYHIIAICIWLMETSLLGIIRNAIKVKLRRKQIWKRIEKIAPEIFEDGEWRWKR